MGKQEKIYRKQYEIGGIEIDNELKFPYIVGEKAEILYNGEWEQGVIVDGYRFRDGRVNVQIEGGEIISCSEENDYMYRKI